MPSSFGRSNIKNPFTGTQVKKKKLLINAGEEEDQMFKM